MYREVERPLGVFDPLVRLLVEGPELPVLAALERTGGAYVGFGADGTSPVGLFIACLAVIAVIWWPRGSPSIDRSR
jgi:hypothetical protein